MNSPKALGMLSLAHDGQRLFPKNMQGLWKRVSTSFKQAIGLLGMHSRQGLDASISEIWHNQAGIRYFARKAEWVMSTMPSKIGAGQKHLRRSLPQVSRCKRDSVSGVQYGNQQI